MFFKQQTIDEHAPPLLNALSEYQNNLERGNYETLNYYAPDWNVEEIWSAIQNSLLPSLEKLGMSSKELTNFSSQLKKEEPIRFAQIAQFFASLNLLMTQNQVTPDKELEKLEKTPNMLYIEAGIPGFCLTYLNALEHSTLRPNLKLSRVNQILIKLRRNKETFGALSDLVLQIALQRCKKLYEQLDIKFKKNFLAGMQGNETLAESYLGIKEAQEKLTIMEKYTLSILEKLNNDIGKINFSELNLTASLESIGKQKIINDPAPSVPTQESHPEFTVWNLPDENKFYIKRTELFKKITHQLNTSSEQKRIILSIDGLGGVSKTQLAQHYILNPEKTYSFRAWFQASNIGQVDYQYKKLAQALGLCETAQLTTTQQIKQWLETHPGWLIVYDDVQSYDELQDYLPTQGGHLIITTRNAALKESSSIFVDALTEEEAIELLQKTSGRYDPGMAELARQLGYLPLTLAEAGNYIAEMLGPTKYLNKGNRQKMLNDNILTTGTQHAPVSVSSAHLIMRQSPLFNSVPFTSKDKLSTMEKPLMVNKEENVSAQSTDTDSLSPISQGKESPLSHTKSTGVQILVARFNEKDISAPNKRTLKTVIMFTLQKFNELPLHNVVELAKISDEEIFNAVIDVLTRFVNRAKVFHNKIALNALTQAICLNEQQSLNLIQRLPDLVLPKLDLTVDNLELLGNLLDAFVEARITGYSETKLTALQDYLVKELHPRAKKLTITDVEKEELEFKIDYAYQASLRIGSNETRAEILKRKELALLAGVTALESVISIIAGTALTFGTTVPTAIPAIIGNIIHNADWFKKAYQSTHKEEWYQNLIHLKTSIIITAYGKDRYDEEDAQLLSCMFDYLKNKHINYRIKYGIIDTLAHLAKEHPENAVKNACLSVLKTYSLENKLQTKALLTLAELAKDDDVLHEKVSTFINELKSQQPILGVKYQAVEQQASTRKARQAFAINFIAIEQNAANQELSIPQKNRKTSASFLQPDAEAKVSTDHTEFRQTIITSTKDEDIKKTKPTSLTYAQACSLNIP